MPRTKRVESVCKKLHNETSVESGLDNFPGDYQVWMNVVGRSMEPTIHDGAQVWVDYSQRKFQHNNIYIIKGRSGKFLIKRLVRVCEYILACSDNRAEYEPFMIKEEQIVAKAGWVLQPLI